MIPLKARLPLPWITVCGIAVALQVAGSPLLALLVLLSADAYLRPGEALSLTPSHVVESFPDAGAAYRHVCLLMHPFSLGVASKTGQFDESVVFGSVWQTKVPMVRHHCMLRVSRVTLW